MCPPMLPISALTAVRRGEGPSWLKQEVFFDMIALLTKLLFILLQKLVFDQL